MTIDRPQDVAVLTPWYPTRQLPFRGAFVQAMVQATAPGCDSLTVYHCDDWNARLTAAADTTVRHAYHEVLARGFPSMPADGGATLLHLPVIVRRGAEFAEIARRHAATLAIALRGQPIPAGVVHAHVAVPSGWAAIQNARGDAAIFVTEHATYLDRILAEPAAREMYDKVLERCTALYAVGDEVRRLLLVEFPRHAAKLGLMPNPISFDRPRQVPVTALRRWLYVGGLIERKGVDLLLEAFAICRADEPELTLTLIGEGGLRGPLAARADELGVAGAVTFAGAVPPAHALDLMREHDLLVHPSRYETFGVTVVEAVAAGMPVLVTRCGGPEETLAGIDTMAGQLIDVTDDPLTIVDGYRSLRKRFPAELDLAGARDHLESRYGYQKVAAEHHRVWFPAQPAAPGHRRATRSFPEISGSTVVFVALGADRRRTVVAESALVVAAGGRAVVVVDNQATWRDETFGAAVEIVDIGRLADPHLPTRTGKAVLYRIPRFALRTVGRGPLKNLATRVRRGYERRLANPAHRRLVARADRRRPDRWGDVIRDRAGGHIDLLVSSDPKSMPLASAIISSFERSGSVAPTIVYGLPLTAPVTAKPPESGNQFGEAV